MNKRFTIPLAATLALSTAGIAMQAYAQDNAMTFFVSSANPGKGADLGGLDGADACFKLPVAVEVDMPRIVDRGCDIGARNTAQDHCCFQAGVAGSEIAAVDQDVAVGRKRFANSGDLVQVLTLHRGSREGCAAEIEQSFRAMADDMDRVDSRAPFQGGSNLLDAVTRGIEDHNLYRGIEGGDDLFDVLNGTIDKCDFGASIFWRRDRRIVDRACVRAAI